MHLEALHLSVLTLLCAPAAAQSIVPLVVEGDQLAGIGTVTAVNQVTLVGPQDWIVEVKTDNPAADTVAIRNGHVFLAEGDPVSAPAGATISILDSYAFARFGWLATNYTLANTVGPNDHEAVYFDGQLSMQRGQPAIANGFSPGTTWGSFGDIQLDEGHAGGALMLVRGYADDPAIAGTTDYFAVLANLDASGNLQGALVLAKEGDIPPGQSETINTIRTGSWNGRIAPGVGAFWACDLNGSDASDACVYRWAAGVNTLVAQEGSPSPVAGRNWGSLVSPEIDVNPAGDWTLKDTLDGSGATDGIIVRNGVKFVQEGDGHPDIAPFVLNELGNGPAKLTDSGSVLWFGGWNDTAPLAYREALFLDSTIIVREGQTTIGGVLLTDIDQQNDSFTITPDGQFVIFKGTLAGGLEGAFLLSFSGISPYCTAKLNSLGEAPWLSWSGTPSAAAGSGFVITAHDVVPAMPGILFYGTSGAAAIPLQNALLCVSPPITRLGLLVSGPPPATYAMDFNTVVAQGNDPALVAGATVHAQFWSRDTGLPPPFPTGLTGGLLFTLQP